VTCRKSPRRRPCRSILERRLVSLSVCGHLQYITRNIFVHLTTLASFYPFFEYLNGIVVLKSWRVLFKIEFVIIVVIVDRVFELRHLEQPLLLLVKRRLSILIDKEYHTHPPSI
jgi:hypothetical protein